MPVSLARVVWDPRVVVEGREHFDPWWMVLACEPGILEAARAEIAATGVRLTWPRWGAHVSVIAGEEPPAKARWGERAGAELEIEVRSEVQSEGNFFWLEVVCEAALDLREAVGLARAPAHPLHLTLGRRKGK